jgi:hypothetical protein
VKLVAALVLLALAAPAAAEDCTTVTYWDTVSANHGYSVGPVYGRAFIYAMRSLSHSPMPPDMAAAAEVHSYEAPDGSQIHLRFFALGSDGKTMCDVGDWTAIPPAALEAVLREMGTPA